jgi:hypothetical protein
MRTILPELLENGRLRSGRFASDTGDLHGLFHIMGPNGLILRIVSSGHDSEFKWEHVSVSTEVRCPTWDEMCIVKESFWDDEEVVMQLHPAKRDYVNHHPHCLHLWKPLGQDIPQPDAILVGPK